MHAFLIDPFTRTVTRVERKDTNSPRKRLLEIYSLIDCVTIDAVRPSEAHGDVFYVDDEGQLRNEQAWFFCRLFPHQAFGGKVLWVGTTADGNDRDPRCSLDYVSAHIVWLADIGTGLLPVNAKGEPL